MSETRMIYQAVNNPQEKFEGFMHGRIIDELKQRRKELKSGYIPYGKLIRERKNCPNPNAGRKKWLKK